MLRGKIEKIFWFSSLGQMVQFGAIIFCRTFKNYFGQFAWIEKKRFTIIVAFHFMKRRLKTQTSKGDSDIESCMITKQNSLMKLKSKSVSLCFQHYHLVFTLWFLNCSPDGITTSHITVRRHLLSSSKSYQATFVIFCWKVTSVIKLKKRHLLSNLKRRQNLCLSI